MPYEGTPPPPPPLPPPPPPAGPPEGEHEGEEPRATPEESGGAVPPAPLPPWSQQESPPPSPEQPQPAAPPEQPWGATPTVPQPPEQGLPEQTQVPPPTQAWGPATTPPQQQGWGQTPQQPWGPAHGQAPYAAQPYATAQAPRKRAPVGLIIGCVVLLLVGMATCCIGVSWYFARQAGGMVGLSAVGWYYNAVQGSYDAMADLTVGGRAEAERLSEELTDQFGRLTPTGQEMVGIKPRLSADGGSAEVPIRVDGSKGGGTLVLHPRQASGGLWQVEDFSVEDFSAY